MRRALAVSIVLTAVNLAAGAAVAQQAPTNASGLRYLSWPGKPTVAARATPTPAVIQAEAPAPTVTAANRTLPGVIPLARLSPAPSVAPSTTTSRTVTRTAAAPGGTATDGAGASTWGARAGGRSGTVIGGSARGRAEAGTDSARAPAMARDSSKG